MSLGLVSGGENTSGLDNVVSTSFAPLDFFGVSGRVDSDGVSVDNELAILGLDGALEATVSGVILGKVDPVVVSKNGAD